MESRFYVMTAAKWEYWLEKSKDQVVSVKAYTSNHRDPKRGTLAGVCMSVGKYTCYVAVGHKGKNAVEPSIKKIKAFLEKTEVIADYDTDWWLTHNMGVRLNIVDDVHLLERLVQVFDKLVTDGVVQGLTGGHGWEQRSTKAKVTDYATIDISDSAVGPKFMVDALDEVESRAIRAPGLKKKMQDLKLDDVYKIDLSASRMMSSVYGYSVDPAGLNSALEGLENKQKDLASQIFKTLRVNQFSLNSTKQLARYLFTASGLNIKPPMMTKTNIPSTSLSALEKIADKHPVIGQIMEWRSDDRVRASVKSVFEDASNEHVFGRWHVLGDDGSARIYSRNTTVTSVPDLCRKCFVPPKGFRYMGFDYESAEFRVLAAMSKDKNMLSLIESERDVHKHTYSLMTGVPYYEVSDKERRIAKVVLYATLYSVDSGAYHISQNLGVDMGLAVELEQAFWHNAYPELRLFRERQVDKAFSTYGTERAFVVVPTLMGRLRFIPWDGKSDTKNAVKNCIANALGQQSCATLLKVVMRRIWDEVSRDYSFLAKHACMGGFIPVFDALWFTVSNDVSDKEVLEQLRPLVEIKIGDVVMKANWKVGPNWGEVKSIECLEYGES